MVADQLNIYVWCSRKKKKQLLWNLSDKLAVLDMITADFGDPPRYWWRIRAKLRWVVWNIALTCSICVGVVTNKFILYCSLILVWLLLTVEEKYKAIFRHSVSLTRISRRMRFFLEPVRKSTLGMGESQKSSNNQEPWILHSR